MALTIVAVGLPAFAGEWFANHRVVFGALGALCAPVLGVVAANSSRSETASQTSARNFVPAGIVGWALGMAVGWIPMVGEWLGVGEWRLVHPWTLYAFATAWLTFKCLATIRLGPSLISTETDDGPTGLIVREHPSERRQ